MPNFHEHLAYRFRKQQEFASDYSPLYAALFGALAELLAQQPADPLASWLVRASNGRRSFDVPLLLLAGLHRDLLLGEPPGNPLARFYPTVGGDAGLAFELDEAALGGICPTAALVTALRSAIGARQSVLAEFIQTFTVQTNETGRGIIWLLPLALLGWSKVHLVDLGASAGLNLVADQRAYRFVDEGNGRILANLGRANTPQFTVQVQEDLPEKLTGSLPHIQVLSRTGCDLRPFRLATAVDEQTLAAFIWGDQVLRLQRLREGIAAFRVVQGSETAVALHKANLPAELPQFLQTKVPKTPHPIIIYNTYITMYLADYGQELRRLIAEWAAGQNRPVLWLQWEPAKNVGYAAAAEPVPGWLAWTADLWQDNQHQQWLLGWSHPHGHHLQWSQEITNFPQKARLK